MRDLAVVADDEPFVPCVRVYGDILVLVLAVSSRYLCFRAQKDKDLSNS